MKPHYRLTTQGYIFVINGNMETFAGYLKWGGWYDISGCVFLQ